MEILDYRIAWAVYAIAGLAFSVLTWGFLKRFLWRELAYLLQCLLLAIIYTPWYVLADQDILAPAFIIFFMDTITIDGVAGVRALIPLIMGLLLAIIVSIALIVMYRLKKRKIAKATEQKRRRVRRKKTRPASI